MSRSRAVGWAAPSCPTASEACRRGRPRAGATFRRDVRELQVRIDTGKVLRLVTNDLASPAEGIELFFDWVKRTPRIRKFLGTSEDAVRIQPAVALIAFLLLGQGVLL